MTNSTENIFYEELLKHINKDEAFCELAELFYKKNFSTASKSEVELLMFHFFMDAMISLHKEAATNVLDYTACSDYKISKQLGITQERVRNLKIRAQARYPEEFDWKLSLQSLSDSIRYDEVKKRIIIPIPDPNLYIEIKNFIEENGGYVEVQRSGNYIQIRPEYYVLLMYDSVPDEEKKKIASVVQKELSKRNPKPPVTIESKIDMVNHILGIAENGLSILANLMELKFPLAIAIKPILQLFKEKEAYV